MVHLDDPDITVHSPEKRILQQYLLKFYFQAKHNLHIVPCTLKAQYVL